LLVAQLNDEFITMSILFLEQQKVQGKIIRH
jgi:hypothetical protein